MTHLFCPEIVLRHVGEPAIDAEFARPRNSPPGLLKHLAIKSGKGLFAAVDPSAGKLEFSDRSFLMRQEDPTGTRQNGIYAGPDPISPSILWRSNARDHRFCPIRHAAIS